MHPATPRQSKFDVRIAAPQHGTMKHQPEPASLVSVLFEGILSRVFIMGQALYIAQDTSLLLPLEKQVSRVNGHWRRVALATQELWRRIDVVSGKSVDEIKTYCERSGLYPIDVHFDSSHWNEGPLPSELVTLLTNHNAGWRKAVIYISLATVDHDFLRYLSEGPIPGTPLRHLSLSISPGFERNLLTLPAQPVNLNHAALEFVRLRGYSVHFFRPSLASVTTLHIEIIDSLSLGYIAVRELLTASSELVHLSLYGNDDPFLIQTWPTQSTQTIFLPKLQSLRLRTTHGPTYAMVLMHIHAPSLRSLFLKELQETDLDPFWPYAVTNGGCFPSLDSLSFHDFEFAGWTYYRAFTAFPNIAHFSLIHSSPEGIMIPKLLGERRYARAWPKLHTLSILLVAIDERELCDMLAVRASENLPLAKLRIGGNRTGVDSEGLDDLAMHVEIEVFEELDPWTEHIDEDDIF